MKVCIFGLGSVGSYLAAKLAQSGACEVSAIGRGAHLEAVQHDGLRFVEEDGSETRVTNINAVTSADQLLPQDFVFATVKAHGLPSIADDLAKLVKPEGAVIFANNGIPWWWNHGLPGNDGPLKQVDPNGRLWRGLGPERALGCVLYSANSIPEPGTITHLGNNRWQLAEPSNVVTDRVQRVVALMQKAGLEAEISADLRLDIWKKLLRNAPFNSLCALTRLPASEFIRVPELIDLAQRMTDEVRTIAAAKGYVLPPSDVMDTIKSGGFLSGQGNMLSALPSMLQDALLGRPMEVAAILGQINAFAQDGGLDVPVLSQILAILEGLDASITCGGFGLSR